MKRSGNRIAFVTELTHLLGLKKEIEKVGNKKVRVPLALFGDDFEQQFTPILDHMLKAVVDAGYLVPPASVELDPGMVFKTSSSGLLTKVVQNKNNAVIPSDFLDVCEFKIRLNVHGRLTPGANMLTIQMVATTALCFR